MERLGTYKNCHVAVLNSEFAIVIECPPELEEMLNGCALQDDCLDDGVKSIPTDRGVYIADIEVWFQQGYCDGREADGESDWDFILTNVREAEIREKKA